MLSAKPNPRTPPTQAVMDARRNAAIVRVVLAVAGGVLALSDPAMSRHPGLAAAGFGVIAISGAFQASGPSERGLQIEEPAAALAGVLLVTLGPDHITGLTLLWLCAVAAGVIARGGRATAIGRIVIVAVLASPMIRFGVTGSGTSLFVAGVGLLLVVGRITVETSELMRDPLTGVISRAALTGELGRLVAGSETGPPVALIMVDLDNFGAVNKQQGHAAGDALLVRASETIAVTLGPEDLLGRLGGDEFAVLTSAAQPGELGEQIVRGLTDAGISASAGIAQCPLDATDPSGLLAAADVAMRLSKRRGKSCVTTFGAVQPPSDERHVTDLNQPVPRGRARPIGSH
jgi:diguanylate cyclase (GGDEF)-like protein